MTFRAPPCSTKMCDKTTHYCNGSQITEGGGGASGTYVGEEKCAQCFGAETCGKETIWKT